MSPSTPSPSQTIIAERYELQRRLAQGGMAEVWLAVDLTLDRKVAVKWLKPLLASDELVAERFRREAIAAASLNHPNIVAVHDVFEHEGRQAVVMQLVDGKSLRQLLDTQKRLSPELTTHIGVCVAAALDHAHENNFVHRDVKPGNIMITPDGRVLLTDFGIAKALAGGDDLTNDNIMMGTAKYLSPEQVRGKKLDGRADLYSLGLVLYECLAGRVPFLGETDADTALARLQRDPTDLTRLRPTLPRAMVDIIHQLLTRNPANRPATGRELIAGLEAALKEGPPVIDDTPYEQTSLTPPTGRLRRAPSDLDRRAAERRKNRRDRAAAKSVARNDPQHAASVGESGTRQPDASQPDLEQPADADRSDARSPRADTRQPSRRSRWTDPVSPVTPSTPPSSGGLPHRIPGEPVITGSVPTTTPSPSPSPTRPDPATPPATSTGRIPVTAKADAPGPAAASQPSTPASNPVTSATTPPPPTQRDNTPAAGAGLRGKPAKGMVQNRRPSLTVVGGLLSIAAIVVVVLLLSIAFGGGDSSAPSTVLPPGATSPADATTGDGTLDGIGDDANTDTESDSVDGEPTDESEDSTPASGGTPPQIATIATYDPEGDSTENDADAALALVDDDPSTAWRTVCYGSRFMGGKRGTGLVVTLDQPAITQFSVDVVNGPYQLEFLTSASEVIPATFAGWDAKLGDTAFASDGETVVSATPGAPVRHVLLLLNEIGADPDCSGNNPFRGGLGEVGLVPG